MTELHAGLRDEGFVPTDQESPVHEDGMLWTNGVELVCNKTSTVIDGNHHIDDDDEEEIETRCGDRVYRYQNSENVKLIGGYVSNYTD